MIEFYKNGLWIEGLDGFIEDRFDLRRFHLQKQEGFTEIELCFKGPDSYRPNYVLTEYISPNEVYLIGLFIDTRHSKTVLKEDLQKTIRDIGLDKTYNPIVVVSCGPDRNKSKEILMGCFDKLNFILNSGDLDFHNELIDGHANILLRYYEQALKDHKKASQIKHTIH
nr:hypothetical protein [Candidatus Woesearchaeota archaeon]